MRMQARDSTITTIEQLQALPEDGLRHELLEGAHVVTPAPSLPHQATIQQLYLKLVEALAARDDLTVFLSPADVVLLPDTLVQPDLFVVRKAPERRLASWSEIGIPILAVEILSPSTAARDRGAKRRIYQKAGVAQYWIVDLDARIVERWTSDDERPEIIDGPFDWKQDANQSIRLDITSIFEQVLGPA